MASFTRNRKFVQNKPIYASVHNIRRVRSVQLQRQYITADAAGKKALPAGIFAAKLKDSSNNEIFRPLPRGTVTTAATTGSARFKVGFPYTFIAGDVLYFVEPFAKLDVASNSAAGTVTVNGVVFSFTPSGAATAAEAATQFAEHYNNTGFLNQLVRFVADGAVLWVVAKDGYSQVTLTPDGTQLQNQGATKTDPVTTTANTTALGTVSFIDTATEEVVLAANSTAAVPVGINVGVKVDEIYGLLDSDYEFTDQRPNADVAVTTEAYVYRGSLPYYDDTVKTYLPDLVIQYKF